MEEPIKFDVFGKLIPEKKRDAIAFLLTAGHFTSELKVRVAVNASCNNGSQTLLLGSVGLKAAQKFTASTEWAYNFNLVQEGYSPGSTSHYCDKHDFYFEGILGCHICEEFYAA